LHKVMDDHQDPAFEYSKREFVEDFKLTGVEEGDNFYDFFFDTEKRQWVNWMDTEEPYEVSYKRKNRSTGWIRKSLMR
jgi:hypothetical protein